jgi:hypothetical protein
MAISQSVQLSNRTNIVEELYVEAGIDALNFALMNHSISAESIIAIIPVPGQTMVKPTPAQFRVLYRTG